MEEIDSYSTTIRVISTVLVVLSSGGNLLAVYLLMSTPRNERSTFVLLLKIFCGSMAIGCLTGWLTLDTSSWLDIDGRPHIVMMSFGPLSFLGSPRLVHFVDWSSMIANTYTPVLVGEMMFFRTLIVYNIKYSKTVMLITTFFCIVYAIPINYAPLAGYIDIHQLRPLLHDISLVNETMEHVSFGIDFGENGMTLWDNDSYLRAVIFVICIVLRILMTYKLHALTENMSRSTRKIHTAFLTILTFDSAVVFIYFIGSSAGIFEWFSAKSAVLSVFINTFPYPFFTFGPAVQSVALLYCVPYMRTALFGLVKKDSRSSVVIPSITLRQLS